MKINKQRLMIQIGTNMGSTVFLEGDRKAKKGQFWSKKKKGSGPVQKKIFQRTIGILFDFFPSEYWHGTTNLYTAFLAHLIQILSLGYFTRM